MIDLRDPETGKIHPCKYSRVTWAMNEFGFVIANPAQFAEAKKMISGMAEPGETIRPAPIDEDEMKVAPGRQPRRGPEEESESYDVEIIPIA